jgi:RNA recognition motif-containing protein
MRNSLECAYEERIVKLFVGGINRKADNKDITEFTSHLPGYIDFSLARDKNGKSRGFGFIQVQGDINSNKLIENDSYIFLNKKIEFKVVDELKATKSKLLIKQERA